MAQDIPVTTAVRLLRENKIDFEPFFYEYEEKGGTAVSSRELASTNTSLLKL